MDGFPRTLHQGELLDTVLAEEVSPKRRRATEIPIRDSPTPASCKAVVQRCHDTLFVTSHHLS